MDQARAQEPSAVRAYSVRCLVLKRCNYDSPSPLNHLALYAVDVNFSSLTRVAWLLLSSFMEFFHQLQRSGLKGLII